MIPVPIFPIDFLLAVFLFLLGLLWQGKIVLHAWLHARHSEQAKAARSIFFRRKRRSLIITVVLQLPILYYVYLIAHAVYIEHATHQTLTAPLTYGEIVFPVGTQLVLHHPNDLSQIRRVILSAPIRILDMDVKSIEFESFWVTLELAKSATIEGWQCDARDKVKLSWEAEQNNSPSFDESYYAQRPRFWYLASCILQPHQTYYGLRWPKNSFVKRTSGKGLISLTNDRLSSLLSDEDQAPVPFRDGEFREFSLQLDENLRITGCNGEVGKAFHVGRRYFAAGERFYNTDHCDLLQLQATR